jgi:hypothetical protein
MDVTIFEQDGKVYAAFSHRMPSSDLAKQTAKAIREMPNIPRARMRVVSTDEVRNLPFATPKKT